MDVRPIRAGATRADSLRTARRERDMGPACGLDRDTATRIEKSGCLEKKIEEVKILPLLHYDLSQWQVSRMAEKRIG